MRVRVCPEGTRKETRRIVCAMQWGASVVCMCVCVIKGGVCVFCGACVYLRKVRGDIAGRTHVRVHTRTHTHTHTHTLDGSAPSPSPSSGPVSQPPAVCCPHPHLATPIPTPNTGNNELERGRPDGRKCGNDFVRSLQCILYRFSKHPCNPHHHISTPPHRPLTLHSTATSSCCCSR